MLYVSLVLSSILLLVVNVSAFLRRPNAGFLACGVGLILLPILLPGFFSPPVAIQSILLCVALSAWWMRTSKRGSFLFPSLTATAVAYGISALLTLPEQREFARLRQRYPYESMEQRLPTPHSTRARERLPEDTEGQLILLERTLPRSESGHAFMRPGFLLRRLHEERVSLFVNSSGFGVARMMGLPSEEGISSRRHPVSPVPQPTSAAHRAGDSDDAPPTPGVAASEGLRLMHQEGVVDFVYPAGFGYVKDRRHVAGFQAHRFSSMPGSEEMWQVQRLELVGLLLHQRPVVYVSENLPRMDELHGAPTRHLDRFETAALEKLHQGAYLLVADTPEGVRMLGAIRSVKQCVSCHGGERGDLLGAFSYTLCQTGGKGQ